MQVSRILMRRVVVRVIRYEVLNAAASQEDFGSFTKDGIVYLFQNFFKDSLTLTLNSAS